MPCFLVKEHLKTKCPKLEKISLAETLSRVTIRPFWKIPILSVVVAMGIVITSVIGGFVWLM